MHLATALRRFARFRHHPISPHAIAAPVASPASGLQQELRSAESVRFSDTAAANSLISLSCKIRRILHLSALPGFFCKINDLRRWRCKNLRHLAARCAGCAPFWCIWHRSAASFTRQLARLAAWTRQLAALQAPGCAGRAGCAGLHATSKANSSKVPRCAADRCITLINSITLLTLISIRSPGPPACPLFPLSSSLCA